MTSPTSTPRSQDSDSFLGAVDLTGLDGLFSAEEKQTALKVRGLVDELIRPNIARWYEEAVFPTEIIPELGKLGVLGMDQSMIGRFAGVILDYFTEQGLSSQLLGTLGGLWGTSLTPAAPVAGRGA